MTVAVPNAEDTADAVDTVRTSVEAGIEVGMEAPAVKGKAMKGKAVKGKAMKGTKCKAVEGEAVEGRAVKATK
eukprot:1512462-Rhodomonas_salina.1